MNKMKNFVNRSCSPDLIFLQENHFQKNQTDFCIRKLTLNIKKLQFSRALCKIWVTDIKKVFS